MIIKFNRTCSLSGCSLFHFTFITESDFAKLRRAMLKAVCFGIKGMKCTPWESSHWFCDGLSRYSALQRAGLEDPSSAVRERPGRPPDPEDSLGNSCPWLLASGHSPLSCPPFSGWTQSWVPDHIVWSCGHSACGRLHSSHGDGHVGQKGNDAGCTAQSQAPPPLPLWSFLVPFLSRVRARCDRPPPSPWVFMALVLPFSGVVYARLLSLSLSGSPWKVGPMSPSSCCLWQFLASACPLRCSSESLIHLPWVEASMLHQEFSNISSFNFNNSSVVLGYPAFCRMRNKHPRIVGVIGTWQDQKLVNPLLLSLKRSRGWKSAGWGIRKFLISAVSVMIGMLFHFSGLCFFIYKVGVMILLALYHRLWWTGGTVHVKALQTRKKHTQVFVWWLVATD